ncbi:transposase [Chryseobacterium lineare]
MKRIKFRESQIVKAIKEHENGKNVYDFCGELEIGTATFYKLCQRYGGAYIR